ncbi:MAG: metal-dependent hydrolase [Desulfococcaceae bacterium]
MYVGSHFAIPVVAATLVDLGCLAAGRSRLFSNRELLLVGFCGVLPDLLSPHLRLSARLTSWSHTVWFAIGLLPVLWMFFRKRETSSRWRMTAFCWIAAVLHLLGDAVSGGIAPFYPLTGFRWGWYLVPWRLWGKIDLGMLTGTAALVFAATRWNRRITRCSEVSGRDSEPVCTLPMEF